MITDIPGKNSKNISDQEMKAVQVAMAAST